MGKIRLQQLVDFLKEDEFDNFKLRIIHTCSLWMKSDKAHLGQMLEIPRSSKPLKILIAFVLAKILTPKRVL